MTTKEQQLIDRIEKAKKELATLRAGRKLEVAQLAQACGITGLDNAVLKAAFTALASEHAQVLAANAGVKSVASETTAKTTSHAATRHA